MPALIGDARLSLKTVDRPAKRLQTATEAATPDLRRRLQQADRTVLVPRLLRVKRSCSCKEPGRC
jgi:hypothetical protein